MDTQYLDTDPVTSPSSVTITTNQTASNLEHLCHHPGYATPAVQAILSIIIVLTNVIVIVTIVKSRQLQTPTFYLIVHLSVSDVIFGVALCVRLFLLVAGKLDNIYVPCMIVLSLLIVSGGCAVTGIALLSLERYWAVVRAHSLHSTFSMRNVCLVVIATWLFWCALGFSSFIFGVKPSSTHCINSCFIGNGFQNDSYLLSLCCLYLAMQIPVWYIQIITFKAASRFLLPPSERIPCANQQLTALKASQRWSLDSPRLSRAFTSAGQKEIMDSLLALSRLVFLIMGVFSLCWLPFIITLTMYTACPDHCGIQGTVLTYLSAPLALNAFTNILIYAVRSPGFRVALRNMCQRKS